MRLHEGETRVDEALVERLIAAQVPTLRAEPVTRMASLGTVHHVFRVGPDHVARLPRLPEAAADFPREAAVLDRVAGRLPVDVPSIVHIGAPAEGFPIAWALHRWLPGDIVGSDGREDVHRAEDVAAVIAALHDLDPTGLPAAGRLPLRDLDTETRTAITATTELDRAALTAAWDRALLAPVWDGRRWVIHADLLPPNLLERAGRLGAVIDWGAAGAGDPAHDLVTAWATLRTAGRARLRHLLQPDDGVWARARGIALHQALLSIPYYRHTLPIFAALNVATAGEVLADRSTP